MHRLAHIKDGEKWMNWVGMALLGGGETKILHRVPQGVGTRGFSGLAWSADGKSILFQTSHSDDRDDLWRVRLDGSPAERLLTTPGIVLSIAVHPNGREISLDSLDFNHRELWVMEGLK